MRAMASEREQRRVHESNGKQTRAMVGKRERQREHESHGNRTMATATNETDSEQMRVMAGGRE